MIGLEPAGPPEPIPSVIAGTNETAGARKIRTAFDAARSEARLAFVPYVVAGYPDIATSPAVTVAAVDAGADVIEIGLPYSDPLADGSTLQRASGTALRAGASFDRCVSLVAALHRVRPNVPIVTMGYANQLLAADEGHSRFQRLAAAGACGVILADLTPDEGGRVEAAAVDAELALVYLVTPTTPVARRATIAERTGGFLYAVSLVGVTGARRALPRDIGPFLRAVRSVSPVPVAVGFGVSHPDQVRRLRGSADGVIVASALVDALGTDGTDIARMTALARSLREATSASAGRTASRAA